MTTSTFAPSQPSAPVPERHKESIFQIFRHQRFPAATMLVLECAAKFALFQEAAALDSGVEPTALLSTLAMVFLALWILAFPGLFVVAVVRGYRHRQLGLWIVMHIVAMVIAQVAAMIILAMGAPLL